MTPETVPRGGLAEASRRTEDLDATVQGAVTHLIEQNPARLALAAVGSYGRGEVSPHSDVDVLVLHDLPKRADPSEMTRAALYPLWDLGFELGYAVRTVPQCLESARDDPVIATTLLDVRLVAGEGALVEELETAMDKWLRKNRRRLGLSLLKTLDDRYRRYGDAGVDLEPNIKEGRGGLRDLNTLRWLGHDEDDDLASSLDVFLAIRHRLHELAGRREDRVTRELLEKAAETLTPGTTDPRDTLLAAVWSRARPVGAKLGWIAQSTLRPPGRKQVIPRGFALRDSLLVRVDAPPPESDPEAALHAARAAASLAPSDDLVEWAERGDRPIPWTDGVREAFLALLESGSTAGWELLDVTGLWVRYLPEFEGARCKAQHNALHTLCVDAHCWETVMQSLRLRREPAWLASEVWGELERPEILLLAALLHDAGKGAEGDHSRQGVILARRFCERAGFGADIQETVAFLVEHHLDLSDFATGRDINDEDLVVDLATRIADPQRLRHLYVLSLADARATGPAAWSAWKAELLAELYTKLVRVIDEGELVGRDARNRWERARSAVLRAFSKEEREWADAEICAFPRRYLLSQPEALVVDHVAMIRELRSSGGELAPLVRGKSGRCSVVSSDRPGLLSTITGVLAARGIAIHTAEVYTRSDGIAVDALGVAGPGNQQVDPDVWPKVETDIRAALAGELDISAALEERSRRYGEAAPMTDTTSVFVDDSASGWYTIVEVRAPDRIGLLHDLTAVLSELGLDVHFARVATQAGEARDSFSVRTLEGAKVDDPMRLESLVRERLVASCGGPSDRAPK